MSENKQEEILQAINFVEESLPVKEWESLGVKIWPLIRINLGLELLFRIDPESKNQVINNRRTFNRIIKMFFTIFNACKNIIKDYKHNERFKSNTDVTFLVASSTRFFKVEDRWYNPYCDSFINFLHSEDIGYNCLEYSSDHQFKVPRFRPSSLIQLSLYYRFFKAFLKSRMKPLMLNELNGFDEFKRLIDSKFEGFNYFNHRILDLRVYVFMEYKKYFLKKLKKSNTKISINDGYYSLEGMAFIAASKELGIVAIELQHGVQGHYHIAYRKWLNLPQDGYDMFPNYFWTWGRNEADYINSWTNTLTNCEAIVGGNPCLNIYHIDGTKLGDKYEVKIKDIISERGPVNILFTAQAFFELPAFFIETIRSNKDWTFWIRIHPQYLDVKKSVRKQLIDAALDNIIIDEASDFPLRTLMEFMDMHVTEFSSCVLEADVLGVRSIVINNRAETLYDGLIEQGVVLSAYTKNNLEEAIKEILENKKDQQGGNPEEVFRNGLRFLRDKIDYGK